MILRAWQQAAINAALTKYRSPFTHFLCLATPGAGKTVMASVNWHRYGSIPLAA